jgi:hypothetical protein
MRDPLTVPAEAYVPDANRAGPGAPAQPPEWLARWIALLIFFLLEPFNTVRLLRSGRLQSWWQERADLPAGSAQAEAASIRGHFGNAIAWMCHRRGIGPGHKDWPELSRAIVAFGGSLRGFHAGAPARGLQWWENPNVVPGIIPGFGTPAPTTTLLQRVAAASAAPPAPDAMQAEAAHASLPGSWLFAAGRQVFARAGPGPTTGAPACPGLPDLSCLTNGAGARLAPPY